MTRLGHDGRPYAPDREQELRELLEAEDGIQEEWDAHLDAQQMLRDGSPLLSVMRFLGPYASTFAHLTCASRAVPAGECSADLSPGSSCSEPGTPSPAPGSHLFEVQGSGSDAVATGANPHRTGGPK